MGHYKRRPLYLSCSWTCLCRTFPLHTDHADCRGLVHWICYHSQHYSWRCRRPRHGWTAADRSSCSILGGVPTPCHLLNMMCLYPSLKMYAHNILKAWIEEKPLQTLLQRRNQVAGIMREIGISSAQTNSIAPHTPSASNKIPTDIFPSHSWLNCIWLAPPESRRSRHQTFIVLTRSLLFASNSSLNVMSANG